jgi:hypothetical protein
MGRYRFTAKDLAPLKPFLALPFARQVLEAAVPVKTFTKAPIVEELPLAVSVQGRKNPNGIPLEALLLEAQKVSPTATGISVRRGKLLVTHSKPPEAAVSSRLDALFRDNARLSTLATTRRPELRALAAPSDPGGADGAAALVAVLRDPGTPDERWLTAFREYAVKHLIKE